MTNKPRYGPDSWSFAMATPDAVVGGYLDFVLERIAARGFEIRACRLFELDWDRLARMYHHRDDPPSPSGMDELPQSVMTRLYRLAPAAVLTVSRREGSACAEVLACKGATRPAEAAPDSVRHAGEHLIFNLMHCPDDPLSAGIELGYLLGREDAAALVAIAQAPADPRLTILAGPSQLRLCVPAFGGWEAISGPMTAHRIRCRIVQHLAVRLRHDPVVLGLLAKAHDHLLAWRNAVARCATATERLATAGDAERASHEALLRAAAALGDPLLMDGLAALAQISGSRGDGDLEAILAVRNSGIYVSELEKVALDAHLHALRSAPLGFLAQ